MHKVSRHWTSKGDDMTEKEAKLWLDERGRQAIEILGWPEWEAPVSQDRVRLRLVPEFTMSRYGATGHEWLYQRWSYPKQKWLPVCQGGRLYLDEDEDMPRRDYIEAARNLNEHAREWLEERGVYIRPPSARGEYWEARRYVGIGATSLVVCADNYTAALIAAVLAVGKEKPC